MISGASEEELDKLNKDNYGFTMKEIDDDLGRYMIKYSDLLREKQQLISWLEDKIKKCNKSIGTDLLKTNATHSNKIVEVGAYQEVLDFVNEEIENEDIRRD